jgi:hypothetical protein
MLHAAPPGLHVMGANYHGRAPLEASREGCSIGNLFYAVN